MKTADGIFSTLKDDSGVAALVNDRIYPMQAAQGVTVPFVVWLIVASIPDATHDALPAGIDESMIQISCFATTYAAAAALRTAVRTALDGKTLESGEKCTIDAERDLFEPGIDLHHAVLEVHLMRDALAA